MNENKKEFVEQYLQPMIKEAIVKDVLREIW